MKDTGTNGVITNIVSPRGADSDPIKINNLTKIIGWTSSRVATKSSELIKLELITTNLNLRIGSPEDLPIREIDSKELRIARYDDLSY